MSATPDDPYLWLEEVTGDDALAWVRDRNAQTTAAAGRGEAVRRADRARSGRCSTPTTGSPTSRWRGRPPLQLLAGRDEPARAVATHHAASTARRGAAGVGGAARRRRAGAGPRARAGCGRAPACCGPATAAAPDQLSRGGADASVVREFDLTALASSTDGFALPEAKSDRRLDRRRPRLRRHRLRAGVDDLDPGTRASSGVAARDAAERGGAGLRGRRRRTCSSTPATTRRPASSATWWCGHLDFYRREPLPAGRRRAGPHRRAARTPTSTCTASGC